MSLLPMGETTKKTILILNFLNNCEAFTFVTFFNKVLFP